MAERKNIVKGQIGNAIESVAPDHIATVANQIFDERRQEYQDDINENVGYNEENPEFVKVYVIKETNQLLWGIRTNGDIYYGAGIPSQIKEYIDFIASRILNGDEGAPEIDSLNKIINFLDGFSTSETLFEILLELDDKKVDKVEGKSLIDEEYAAGVSYIENPEFKDVRLDADGKIIEANYNDGTKLFGAGVKVNGELELQGIVSTTIESPEFKVVWTINDRILFGVQNDGNFLFGCGIPSQIIDYIEKALIPVKEIIAALREDVGEYTDNPEYIKVISDAVGKITEAIRKDGTMVVPAGIETSKANIDGVLTETVGNPEYIEARVDSEGKIYFGARRDGDVIVGGVNINELKRDLDVDALEVEYNPADHGIYVTENVDSAIGLEYDSETGDLYQVKDSRITADMTMDENGDVYIEQ